MLAHPSLFSSIIQPSLYTFGFVATSWDSCNKPQCEKELQQTKIYAMDFGRDQRQQTKGLYWCEYALRLKLRLRLRLRFWLDDVLEHLK